MTLCFIEGHGGGLFRARLRCQTGALLSLLLACPVLAQSAVTLDAVRLHRPEALSLAREELEACRASAAIDGGALSACEAASRLSLLVGFLALAEGDAPGAVAELTSIAPPRPLAPIHAYYLGQAQFYAQDPAAAARSFIRAQKEAPAWLAGRLRARLGEALLASGEAAKALVLLEKAAVETATPELLWQRALARRALGNLAGQRHDLKSLAVLHPAHPYGSAALLRLGELGPAISLTFDERLARARGLLAAGDAAGALAELELADSQKLTRGASARARLALVRAGALFATGDPASADRELKLAQKGQASIAAEALMIRARRALRANDNLGARALMAEVDRRFPTEPAAVDAGYLAAWLDLQAGRFADSVAAFDAFEKKHPDSKKLDEAHWFRAFALLRLGRYSEATVALEALTTRFPRSPLGPQARYWAARSGQLALKKGESSAAVAARYGALVASSPGSFYARLSIERLQELGKAPARLFPLPRRLAAPVPSELSLALALAQAGLFRDASQEAQARLASVRTPEQALRFGHALQSLGAFGDAHALAVRLLWGAAYGARSPEALALMYPRAYQSAVEGEARARALDPALVWAVMRRESAFRPEVASAADARGLLQIIPPTAIAISKELGTPPPPADALFSPELNIRLSAWYLSALLKRFGHPALAAAAYNAGPTAVAGWAKDKPDLPLDVWIEEIPFKETRGYVKQVMADYFVYHSLYDEPAASVRLPLAVPKPAAEGVSF